MFKTFLQQPSFDFGIVWGRKEGSVGAGPPTTYNCRPKYADSDATASAETLE